MYVFYFFGEFVLFCFEFVFFGFVLGLVVDGFIVGDEVDVVEFLN